jgi:hypothetical protein
MPYIVGTTVFGCLTAIIAAARLRRGRGGAHRHADVKVPDVQEAWRTKNAPPIPPPTAMHPSVLARQKGHENA